MSRGWIWRVFPLSDDPKRAFWTERPLWWRVVRLVWYVVLAVTGQLVLVERVPIVAQRPLRRSFQGYRSPFARGVFAASSAMRAPPV